jgi:hypothetical protein
MMAGRRALRKLQLGREGTAGTETDATDIWRGIGTLLDTRKIERVNEDIGIIGGTTRTFQPMKGGTLNMSQSPSTFEQILHVLEASVKTATPAQDGAGTDYIYTYACPTTSGNTIKTYTIEGGDDAGEEQMLYCFVKDWSLEGSGRNGWNLSANWQGRSVETGTYTSALTLASVNSMKFGLSKLYVDAIGGTIGSTQKTNTLRKASIKYTSGIEAKDTADGRLDFSFIQGTSYGLIVQLEFEHDSVAIAEKVKYRAETPSLFRIKIEGETAFATPGTTYSIPTFIMNLPGKWTNFEKINEANGNDIVQGTFFSAYDTTAAVGPSFVDVVEQATVR